MKNGFDAMLGGSVVKAVAEVRRRKKGLKSHVPTIDPNPAPPSPRHIAPITTAGTSLHPCQVCGSRWDVSTREEVDGELHPVHHVAFLLENVKMPVHTFQRNPITRKITWDIWPVLPDIVRRWLCPKCWHEVWEYGMAQWCQEERDLAERSASGLAIQAAEAANVEIEECELLAEGGVQFEKFLFIYSKFAVEG